MKNKYLTTKSVLSALLLASSLITFGCASEAVDEVEADNNEVVDNLLAAGIALEDIEIRETSMVSLVGKQYMLSEAVPQVFIDGDTHVTLEASRELVSAANVGGEDADKHWRTPSLVTNNRTICLAKVTNAQSPFTSFALTSAMQTGVNRARDNFNALSSFNLTMKAGNASLNSSGQLSHNISGCNFSIFIYKVNGGAGGSAGFPSGGAPFNQVKLNSGLAGFSLDVHEHVATHEIGHSIGLRHTDWKTRSSCGQNSNEGRNGASQISGTPDQTTNSLMASCFSGNSNGEFRGQDAQAFNTIY